MSPFRAGWPRTLLAKVKQQRALVQVTSRPQHEKGEKVAFYKNLTEELERACGISPSDVVVTIFDISDDSWSLGLGRVLDAA
jgi:phenylpyruvate tautomerase PptA (4-oxalocrotonate tautomerase family)